MADTPPTTPEHYLLAPLRVALDLDGTIYDFDGHLRQLYRHHHWNQPQAAILPGNARAWTDCVDDLHFDTIHETLHWYTHMQGWYNQPLYPNARAAVTALQSMPEIYLTCLTARPRASTIQTRAALTRDFGADLDVIVAQEPKHRHGYDLYIDDSPSEIEGFIAHGRQYLIYDQPWNQGLPGRRVYRPTEIYAAVKQWARPDARPATLTKP